MDCFKINAEFIHHVEASPDSPFNASVKTGFYP